MNRNKQGVLPSMYYKETKSDGRSYAIMGNPNLGEVRGIFMGVENVLRETICTEMWFNELRLSELDEKGGFAANARIDFRLADLGSLTLAGTARTQGFGTIDQRVNERSREDVYTLDASATIEAGKLLPKTSIPDSRVCRRFSYRSSTPEYDPYDLDLNLKEKLKGSAADKEIQSVMMQWMPPLSKR